MPDERLKPISPFRYAMQDSLYGIFSDSLAPHFPEIVRIFSGYLPTNQKDYIINIEICLYKFFVFFVCRKY